jgi:hypothetical protein
VAGVPARSGGEHRRLRLHHRRERAPTPLLRARCCRRRGPAESAGAWRAPSRPRASGSRATSCATHASSPTPLTRSRQRSPSLSLTPRLSCWPSRASGHQPPASSSARSPARNGLPPTPSSPAPAGSRRSRSAQARPTAIAWTAAATARSTPPSTASRSPAPAATPKPRPTAYGLAASPRLLPLARGSGSPASRGGAARPSPGASRRGAGRLSSCDPTARAGCPPTSLQERSCRASCGHRSACSCSGCSPWAARAR